MNSTSDLRSLPGWPLNGSFRFSLENEGHIRHAPYPDIVFGGNAFGTRSGIGVTDTLAPSDLRLELLVKPAKSTLEMFEPLYVQVVLQNVSNSRLRLASLLAIETGDISCDVRSRQGIPRKVQPSLVVEVLPEFRTLEPGGVIANDIVLLLDSNGAIFESPGVYEIVLSFNGIVSGQRISVRAVPFSIRVLFPNRGEDILFQELAKRDVQMFFELKGADHLDSAMGGVRDILESRRATGLNNYVQMLDITRFASPFRDVVADTIRPANPLKAKNILDELQSSVEDAPQLLRLIEDQRKSLRLPAK